MPEFAMPDLDALRKRLRQTKNLRAVARECGLNLKTLYRTRDGATTPSVGTYQKIIACLEAIESKRGA